MPEEPVGGQTPDMGTEMPPMDDTMPEAPMDSPEGMDNAEGGDDKKKEIQKLAGELSELLHTYNEENGEDEELNKYVKGMIDAQTNGEGDEDEDIEMNDEMEPEETDDDMEMNSPEESEDGDMEEPSKDEKMPNMEGRKLTKKQLKEEFVELSQKEKETTKRVNQKISKNNVKPNNPFTPPKFN